MKINELNIGDTYSGKDLNAIFKGQVQGGLRKSNKTNTLVIITSHVIRGKNYNPYEDKWENNILYYTGQGSEGDQILEKGNNKTLNESNTNGVELHLFEEFFKSKYVYMGIVKLCGDPSIEREPDSNGVERNVYKFPLEVQEGNNSVDLESLRNVNSKRVARITDIDGDELKRLAELASKKNKRGSSKKNSEYREAKSKYYTRDPYISSYVKRLADGKCELCKRNAPFNDMDDKPFLHSHHIKYLSKGGKDTIDNSVAVCPNCHAKIHVLENIEDIKILKKAVKARKK